MSLYVDTSAWYAAADRGDRHNPRAIDLLSSGEALAISDHVLAETWILLRSRIGRHAAIAFWNGIRGGIARVEPVTTADLEVAWSVIETFADQDFSLVDCTSFAVMQRLGIHRAVSFDNDFAVYRFGRDRTAAFEILN